MEHLIHAFEAALNKHGQTKVSFAERIGTTSPMITKFCRGVRPRDALFQAIINGFPAKQTRQTLMCAHLLDEIERAGHNPYDYTVDTAYNKSPNISEALNRIEKFVQQNPDMETILMQFAGMQPDKDDYSVGEYAPNAYDQKMAEDQKVAESKKGYRRADGE